MAAKMNWNTAILGFVTLLLTAGFSVLGFTGKELYYEVRATHDAVLTMKGQMSNYDVQISDVRTRLSAVEVEIQKLKDQRKP